MAIIAQPIKFIQAGDPRIGQATAAALEGMKNLPLIINPSEAQDYSPENIGAAIAGIEPSPMQIGRKISPDTSVQLGTAIGEAAGELMEPAEDPRFVQSTSGPWKWFTGTHLGDMAAKVQALGPEWKSKIGGGK